MSTHASGVALAAIASFAAFAGPAFAVPYVDLQPPPPADLTPEYLAGAYNSSLFTRWRPRSHFIAPNSWMNDPCGALYDPADQTYHLHYQFHPEHVGWGNISWGHAVSKDLFHWKDVASPRGGPPISLAAGEFPSSTLSQFTGSSQPVNVHGASDGTYLTLATGIHRLPISWKKEYLKGAEVQALYSSADKGVTWKEVATVLDGPPPGWTVTGFRDPSFFPSQELDKILQHTEPHYYMVLGSGLKQHNVADELDGAPKAGYLGPRMPLYKAPASDLTKWTFLGPLWEPAANSSLGDPDVTGSFGFNFEVSGLMDLFEPGFGGNWPDRRTWFTTMGAEGGVTAKHWRDQWALWTRGDLSRTANGTVSYVPNSGGALDWGIAYAQATFLDTQYNRRVMWGWVIDDLDPEYNVETARLLGYNGAMGFPTELFLKETKGVYNCGADRSHNNLDGHVCLPTSQSATAQTLGIRPLWDVLERLRQDCETTQMISLPIAERVYPLWANAGSSFFLNATLAPTDVPAGITVARSPDGSEYTNIIFHPELNEIHIVREKSSLLPNFNNKTIIGHFRPYVINFRGEAEDITFNVLLDGSLLEVWVNERFAMTARIYPSRQDSRSAGFVIGDDSTGHTGKGASVLWKNINIAYNLNKAWPDRPDDTSVWLKWDSPQQTNNYTWWPGY